MHLLVKHVTLAQFYIMAYVFKHVLTELIYPIKYVYNVIQFYQIVIIVPMQLFVYLVHLDISLKQINVSIAYKKLKIVQPVMLLLMEL